MAIKADNISKDDFLNWMLDGMNEEDLDLEYAFNSAVDIYNNVDKFSKEDIEDAFDVVSMVSYCGLVKAYSLCAWACEARGRKKEALGWYISSLIETGGKENEEAILELGSSITKEKLAGYKKQANSVTFDFDVAISQIGNDDIKAAMDGDIESIFAVYDYLEQKTKKLSDNYFTTLKLGVLKRIFGLSKGEDGEAAYLQAKNYLYGFCDKEQYLFWLETAMRLEYPDAFYEMYNNYSLGENGFAEDDIKAEKYFNIAIELGSIDAMLERAHDKFLYGKNEDDIMQGAAMYFEMVRDGNNRAAICYFEDIMNVERLFSDSISPQAVKSLYNTGYLCVCEGLKSKDLSYDEKYSLCVLHAYMCHFGYGCPKDDTHTLEEMNKMLKVAKKYGADAFSDMGSKVYHYIGETFFDYDYRHQGEVDLTDEIIYCFEQSSESDDKCKLGDIYLNGGNHYNNDVKDIKKAIETYEGCKSCPEALLMLGNIYAQGRDVKKDIDKAVSYFEQMGKAGYPRGYGLAAYYLEDCGKLVDSIEFYIKGAEGGDEDCIEALREIMKNVKGTLSKSVVNKVMSLLERID